MSCKGLVIAAVCAVIGLRVLGAIVVRVVPSLSTFTLADFKLRDFPRGDFEVEFPSEPSRSHGSAPGRGKYSVYQVARGGWQFSVTHYDIPDNKTFGPRAYVAARAEIKAMASFYELTPTGDPEDLVFQDEPAVEQSFKGPKGDGVVRVVIREDYRIYVLLCSSKSFDPEIAERFLDSFNMYHR